MVENQNTIFLIDASSFIYRSFHAIQGLSRSDGFPTNAVFGFFNILKSILKQYQPEYLALAYDLPGPTFRHEQFEQYKAQRAEMPADLVCQIPYIKKLAESYGLPSVEMPGYEADDLIGTLAFKAREEGFDVVIITNDKDMMQLVSPGIRILHVHGQKSKMYDEKATLERYGVKPDQIPDFLGLMGDSSDNIPGVPGIGQKTAASLLAEFGTLEQALERADEVKGKRAREGLRNYREQALTSRQLATIICDVDLDIEMEDLRIREHDYDSLREILTDLEFHSWLKELPAGAAQNNEYREYILVNTEEKLREMVKALENSGGFAFDTETTGLAPMLSSLVGVSFSFERGRAWYVPVGHQAGVQLEMQLVIDAVRSILENADIPKTAHNLKFDAHVLKQCGIHVENADFDTLVAAYLVEGGDAMKSLAVLASMHCGMQMVSIQELIGKGKNAVTMDRVEIQKVCDYACTDAEVAWLLREYYEPLLKEQNLYELFRELEMPLLSVLVEMESTGVRIDTEVLARQSENLGEKMERLAAEIYTEVGAEFNLNSPKQLAEILFDKMGLPKFSRRSTRADVLDKLVDMGYPVAKKISEYRQVQKLKSTYLDALPNLVNQKTGRLHTSYNQTVANTGRLSSREPNLQNIPIRTDLGKQIREAFVPSEGNRLMGADYSQIELRILAHASRDPGLCEAFSKGYDIHTHTAAEIFDVSHDEVTYELRRRAKAINFGLNYGMSPYGLADRLNLPLLEAAEYMERYFSRYPKVREYVDKTLEYARSRGYVTTLLGRKIKTPGLTEKSKTVRDNASRAAINAPIQGSAADLLKLAMIQLPEKIRSSRMKAEMILTIHDELIFDFPPEEEDPLRILVCEVMEKAVEISVPIVVDIKVGSNWAEL